MKTKYSKSVSWLQPYVEAAAKHVPINKISKIRGYKVALGKMEQAYASIVVQAGGKVSINILTHGNCTKPAGVKGKLKVTHQRRNVAANVLAALSHELAHLLEWEHTPEHWALDLKIQKEFVKVMKKRGVTDTAVRKPL